MPPIDASQGPVAVTGASGYIGSHTVLALVQAGYHVRACVRDATNKLKVAPLLAMNGLGPGSVSLHSCDLLEDGAYDDADGKPGGRTCWAKQHATLLGPNVHLMGPCCLGCAVKLCKK